MVIVIEAANDHSSVAAGMAVTLANAAHVGFVLVYRRSSLMTFRGVRHPGIATTILTCETRQTRDQK